MERERCCRTKNPHLSRKYPKTVPLKHPAQSEYSPMYVKPKPWCKVNCVNTKYKEDTLVMYHINNTLHKTVIVLQWPFQKRFTQHQRSASLEQYHLVHPLHFFPMTHSQILSSLHLVCDIVSSLVMHAWNRLSIHLRWEGLPAYKLPVRELARRPPGSPVRKSASTTARQLAC